MTEFQEYLKEVNQSDRVYIRNIFFVHFLFHISLFILPVPINLNMIISMVQITAIRGLGFLFRKEEKWRKYYINFASVLSLLFIALSFASIEDGLNHENTQTTLFFFNLNMCLIILCEGLRFNLSSYKLLTGLSIVLFTAVVNLSSAYQSLSLPEKNFAPLLVIVVCFILIQMINRSKEDLLRSYSRLFQDKHMMNKDMVLARNVQESLFPKVRTIKGLKYEVYRKTHSEIGGDFYDFIQLREGNVGIFITDVAGHGYSSAMVAAMIKVMVSNIPYTFKLDPGGLLTYIDQKLSTEFISQHASGLYMYVDFIKKEISLANAGHPYVLFSRKGGHFEPVLTSGSILGFGLKTPIADTIHFPFQSGDRFLIYTDGLIENGEKAETQIGEEGLLNILNKKSNLPLPELKEAVLADIINLNGSYKFQDDVMFLLFELE